MKGLIQGQGANRSKDAFQSQPTFYSAHGTRFFTLDTAKFLGTSEGGDPNTPTRMQSRPDRVSLGAGIVCRPAAEDIYLGLSSLKDGDTEIT